MKALRQKLKDILAQASGVRYDVIATRIAGTVGVLAGLAPYAHLIPGQTGALVAGGCAVCAAVLPRATKAAGLLSNAYGQKVPLLKVLPALVQTLLAGASIVAQAKADVKTAEAAQAQDKAAQDKAAQIEATAQRVVEMMKTGAFVSGTGTDSLSRGVPADLAEALASVERSPALAALEKSPALTSVVTIADKAL